MARPEVETSKTVRKRVIQSQQQQLHQRGKLNARLQASELINEQWIEAQALDWLGNAIEKLGQSARAFHRIVRVARTIADLEPLQASTPVRVGVAHIKEALAFRQITPKQ